ncbi:SDR family oxidoreductase [Nevskia ramosa]|uniref:SDR family oxidoreductase n=1 Tax=Nevskia ramosa TaxID=64002 RepID=UPI003D097115
MRRILIMGATSAIAEATAREFAALGDALFLVGRNPDRLTAIADDLRLRGAAQAETWVMDACELGAYPALLDAVTQRLGGLDTALIAHGTLTDQVAAQASSELMLAEFQTNALSHMVLCTELANRFEAQGHGCIAVISSVAGDRGRQSNYVYGSAKAAVTAFTSGLRQRLHPKGVHVLTIKPGFVDTPMTAAFKKGPLWATPAAVAKAIVKAVQKGKPVLYTLWFWWPIMQIIKNVPEAIFRKLKL